MGSETDLILETGLLQPGIEYGLFVEQLQYGLLLGRRSAIDSEGVFSFTMDMTPVPEPASIVLLGSGLIGLLRVRHRRA
jgi:hypothetical protein